MLDYAIAVIPDALSGVGAEQAVGDAEVAFEFQVGPVVKRIAEQVGHSGGEFLELFEIGGVSGAVAFINAIGSHGPPFVVVAAE